jgi:hypothetical protein
MSADVLASCFILNAGPELEARTLRCRAFRCRANVTALRKLGSRAQSMRAYGSLNQAGPGGPRLCPALCARHSLGPPGLKKFRFKKNVYLLSSFESVVTGN